jgi:hypothetical protein
VVHDYTTGYNRYNALTRGIGAGEYTALSPDVKILTLLWLCREAMETAGVGLIGFRGEEQGGKGQREGGQRGREGETEGGGREKDPCEVCCVLYVGYLF